MASKPPAAAAGAAANTTPRKPGTPADKPKAADAKGKGATDKKGKDAGDKAGEGEQGKCAVLSFHVVLADAALLLSYSEEVLRMLPDTS